MNRIFVTADTHFCHKNILKYEAVARPFESIEEHDEELVTRWNATVNPEDTVWHFGDVGFGPDFFKYVARLNGIKQLILGNHDTQPIERYLEHFKGIYGVTYLRGYVLSHMPIHPSQFFSKKGNIHGHSHSFKLDDPRYINVSVEQTGLAPVLLDSVIHKAELLNSQGI